VDASVVRAVHDWAAARSVRLIINASPVPNYLDELVPIGDPLIVNRGEAEQITGLIGADVVELAAALRARAVSVVITDGARGATIARDSETHAIAARHVSAVDTTGAGDAFAGAVAGGLAQGMNLSDAVGVGIAEAARVVSLDRRARGN
jgi:ribokinase